MSKGAFRILLVAYFLFELVVSLYHSFFGMRVPTTIVHELCMVFGEPVPIPQPLALTFGIIGLVLFVWGSSGFVPFLAWRASRVCSPTRAVCSYRTPQAVLHNFGLVRDVHAPSIAFSRIHHLPCILRSAS